MNDFQMYEEGRKEVEYEDELPSECPNCGSDAVGYDGTDKTPIYECFQCDHAWMLNSH